MQLIIFGPPGVGKGTLSDMLADKYKVSHISTGDIFRNEIKSGNSELIEYVEKGFSGKEDNPLKNSPHTVEDVVNDVWEHSYSREIAAFPNAQVKLNKFWPSVGRVNNAYGDRNLVCSCVPISEYAEEKV